MLQNSVNYDVLTPVHFLGRSAAVYPQKMKLINLCTSPIYERSFMIVKSLARSLFLLWVLKR